MLGGFSSTCLLCYELAMPKFKMLRLASVKVLLLWLVACNHTSLTPLPKVEQENHIVLVKEIQLTHDDWGLVRWSPDSSSLLLMKPSTGITIENELLAVVNVENGLLHNVPQQGVGPIWSPDSNTLLIKSVSENKGEQFWLYSLKDTLSVSLTGIIGSPILWLADGRLVYEADDGLWSARLKLPIDDHSTQQISATEHAFLVPFEGGRFTSRWSFPSPDLESVVLYDGTNDNDRKWWLVQPDHTLVNVNKPFYSIGTCCAWARDGRYFAFFSGEPELGLYLVDKDGTNLRQIITAKAIGDGVFVSMDFSPDSQTIAFEWSTKSEGFPFENTQIYLVNSDGSGLRNLTPDTFPHHWLRWSPDGKYIAYFGEQGKLWVAQVTTDKP